MRGLRLILIYAALFTCGYLAVGIVAYYTQPEIKMLPVFVEKMLPARTENPEVQSLDGMTFELLQDEQNDTTAISFDLHYNDTNGIFCFRGNAQRTSPSRGYISGKPTDIVTDWIFTTDQDNRLSEYGSWGGGSGWTGQALIVSWPPEIRKRLYGIQPEYLSAKSVPEVIIGSLSGNIYFLDLASGNPTRPKLSIENPIKGTVSVDPRMNGMLYVGQGIQNGERFGNYVFDLFSGKELLFRNGLDARAHRSWGAFDSNSLIDLQSGWWIQPAENGMIYKTRLDKSGAIESETIFRYSVDTAKNQGIESSFGAWKNLGWFADNGGNLFCLNLITMKPMWIVNNYDDTDASVVVELDESGKPMLYVGNEVDLQGPTGTAYIRCVDGLTGKEKWHVSRECTGTKLGGKTNSGGVLATSLPGKLKAKNLVYGIFSRVENSLKGEFVAIDKKTGEEKFTIPMDAYSWASPLDLYDHGGNCYIFFTDVFGGIYLIDGLNGEILIHKKLDAVFESSPVSWNNRIVLGARGNRIFSFVVK